MEGVGFHSDVVQKMTKKEYVSRVHKTLNADINGDSTITAICTYAIPVLCYMFGIMKWTKGELQKLEVKTRTLLTMIGIHHPKGNVDCLYLQQ
eukprot:6313415-Ditylum_brightwellii.AAC.1